MSIGDFPTMSSSTYASNAVALANYGGFVDTSAQNLANLKEQFQNQSNQTFNSKKETTIMLTRRLVQVVIADPNENVPLDQCLLYSGEQKLTDGTDQELFYEIDIKKILNEYNAKRIKFVDKKVKERVEYLEPAKIRDLKMVVVSIASF